MNIDTVEIKKCGNDFIKLSQEMNEILNFLYSKLNTIVINKAWVGESAEEYLKKANLDKVKAIELKNTIYKLGSTLIKAADDYDLKAKQKNS